MPIVKHIFTYSCSFLLLLCTQCGKKDQDKAFPTIVPGSLTVAPVDFARVSGLVPLGNLNPPGHTFPTRHMYIYFSAPGAVHVYAPGDLRIYQLSRFKNITSGFTDYRIEFGNPFGTVLFLSHLSSIQPGLLEKAGGFEGSTCETYTTGGATMEYCRKQVSINVRAGDLIATANAGSAISNIDMGITVNEVAACPLDYFTASVRADMETKAGTASGSYKRTEPPVCGEYNLDIPGTLQGNWYKQGAPREPEDQHIAFVKDNFQPHKLRISIGSGVPGLASGVYGVGIPDVSDAGNTTGLIDRAFAGITADGQTYCYVARDAAGGAIMNTSFIVKLDDSNTLSFEKRNCDCSCTPYSFTSAKISYTK